MGRLGIFKMDLCIQYHIVFPLSFPFISPNKSSFPPHTHVSHTFLDIIIPKCHTLFVAIISKSFFIGIVVGFARIKELLYIEIFGYFVKLLAL